MSEINSLFKEQNTISLRPYQEDALNKILWAKESNLDGNELVVLPTGAGKSVVIANLVNRLNEPILILQPSKEILEQNVEKLNHYVSSSDIAIYSASMNQKDVGRFTFATIQSIYEKPDEFRHFKLVIIDEAHLVNPKALQGMFTKFLRSIGNPKVIGFTATPYRMDSMYMGWGTNEVRVVTTIKLVNRMKGFFWSRILFNINTSELIEQGYLCNLDYMEVSLFDHTQMPLNKSHSDFDLDKVENLLESRKEKVRRAIAYASENSKSVLVFCSSVRQAEKLSETTPNSAVVTGKTAKKDRTKIIKDFKDGKIKTVFNVGVLTTGFDHPALDCIVLLRPTRSIALYYQMLGRGVRIAEGKTSCKVIDLTSTVKNLGRVETIKLVKRDKWELESETGSWHGAELYSYTMQKKYNPPEIKQIKVEDNNEELPPF